MNQRVDDQALGSSPTKHGTTRLLAVRDGDLFLRKAADRYRLPVREREYA